MHYDAEEGFYYTIGGGSITAGPVRSKTLAAGSWELTPRAPMAANAASLSRVGMTLSEQQHIDMQTTKLASFLLAYLLNTRNV
jgi:hypothetical protein